MPTKKDQTDLFYINEEDLSSTEEEDFQSLMECEAPPDEVADPAVRARYVKYLEDHKDDSDAE